MKTLHLFSNWRWTGPAEPAVNLAAALREAGWEVTFACAQQPRGRPNRVLDAARQHGLPTHTDLRLGKHRDPLRNWADARRLGRWLADEHVHVVHTHLPNALRIAAAGLSRAPRRPLLVHTCYDGDAPASSTERRLLAGRADGLVTVSQKARGAAIDRLGLPPDRVWAVHTAVDLERFRPGIGDRRAEFGIPGEAFVVGIVARVQWHRRYHVFLEAMDRARRELPRLRAIIVGRGTNLEPIALQPIRRMGLHETIVLPGYHTGDDYVRTLATMDAKVYLVPGTDGSCRAAREAMAMGVPVIAARRGVLPELVGEDQRGMVIDDTPEVLCDAILELARQPERRLEMGRRARQFALENFSPARQAEIVGDIYRELAERAEP
ncbi:MAG: glycosyltransferase family 4 protein [Candidatus Brocadiia bacterium]